jgi:hypothetical protein
VCDKCKELDKKIAHFADLAARLSDPPTIAAAKKIIEEMQAEKAQLHPECK